VRPLFLFTSRQLGPAIVVSSSMCSLLTLELVIFVLLRLVRSNVRAPDSARTTGIRSKTKAVASFSESLLRVPFSPTADGEFPRASTAAPSCPARITAPPLPTHAPPSPGSVPPLNPQPLHKRTLPPPGAGIPKTEVGVLEAEPGVPGTEARMSEAEGACRRRRLEAGLTRPGLIGRRIAGAGPSRRRHGKLTSTLPSHV